MICTLCQERPATSRGLCSACYQRERKAGRLATHAKCQRAVCSVDGCAELAASKGLCKRHAEQDRRGTLHGGRAVADLPREQWADVAGHPGWLVSTEGRIKSRRRGHERLIRTRMVDGRLLAGDKQRGNVTVHLAVLRAFCPGVVGDSVFVDGDPTNCRLANLRWQTVDDRRTEAIVMAEASTSRFAPNFASYWRGDRAALDTVFEQMRRLLIVVVPRKMATFDTLTDTEDIIMATMSLLALAINRASLTSLDNLTAYVCTIADHYMLAEHLATRLHSPLESAEGVPVADMIEWCHPSAELVAESREVLA
jgi:hypothetical protein